MATFGSTINPSLGRTDYSAIQQGANAAAQGILAGGQGIARGIEQAGASIASGVEKHFKEQEQMKVMLGELDMIRKSNPDAFRNVDPKIAERMAKGDIKFKEVAPLYAGVMTQQKLEQIALQKQQQTFLNEIQKRQVAADEARARAAVLSAEANFKRAGVQKPENLSFPEQVYTKQIAALEAKAGRKATPQEEATIAAAVQRGGSMAGDPELAARMELMKGELPVIGTRADTALRLKPTVRSLQNKLDSGLKTGKLEPAKTAIIGFAKSVGIPVDEEALGKSEAASGQFGQLMFEWLAQTKGSVTERENTLFQLMGPEFSKSEAANKDLMGLVESRMDFDVELGKIYRDGIAAGKSLPEISSDLQAARQGFSEKYDAKVNGLVESYAKKFDPTGAKAEIERRKKLRK